MSCKFFSLKHHSKLARAHIHKQTRTHAHTHAPISVHTHAFTSHIYYLNHVVCFTSCSCVLLCVCCSTLLYDMYYYGGNKEYICFRKTSMYLANIIIVLIIHNINFILTVQFASSMFAVCSLSGSCRNVCI